MNNNMDGESDMEIEEKDMNESTGSKEILDAIGNVSEELQRLSDLFTRRLMEDKQKNVLIDTVTSGASFAFIEPFLSDLILVLDRLDKEEGDFAESLKDELMDILARRGVSELQVSEGEAFNPSYMKAIRMVESEEVSEVIVSAVSRKGYALSGKVIRPTEVIVARPV